MIDLHMHSTFSDGTDRPEQLVDRARGLGLSAIALTDHDTVEGVPAFLDAAQKAQIKAFAGVEISVDADLPAGGHLHLLGLGIDLQNSILQKTLQRFASVRETRSEAMVSRLNLHGIEIGLDELRREVGEGVAGRPHVARLLVKKGVVGSIQEAFEQYLSKGKPGYVEKIRLGLKEATDLVHMAGGVAVIAHPQFLGFPDLKECRRYLGEAIAAGVDGWEAHYTGLTPEWTEGLVEEARLCGKIVTGGSDYHGSLIKDIAMGDGQVPDAVLGPLEQLLTINKKNG
ncbi:MAG TPA: PHP domain-containing protein [Calditrichia bacterium]|nr:PHP domain-containing protein [Calditrichota bacterium]HQV30511.1 PHP domain-containing protein [Calditrichia bacterium]